MVKINQNIKKGIALLVAGVMLILQVPFLEQNTIASDGNLILNAGFEEGTDGMLPDYWTQMSVGEIGEGTIEKDSQGRTGSAVKFSVTANKMALQTHESSKIYVDGGQRYRLTYWVKTIESSADIYPFIRQHKSDGGDSSNPYYSLHEYTINNVPNWHQVIVDFNVASDTDYIYLWMLASGGTVYLDDMFLCKIPNQSTSLIYNPSFEEITYSQPTGWAMFPLNENSSGSMKREASSGRTGAAMRADITEGSLILHNAETKKISVKPNMKYTFTFWVKMSGLFNTAYPYVRQHQASGNGTFSNDYLPLAQYKVTGKQEWTKVTADFTTESDVSFIYLWVVAGESGTIWLDDYNLSEQEGIPTINGVYNPYFEGVEGTTPEGWAMFPLNEDSSGNMSWDETGGRTGGAMRADVTKGTLVLHNTDDKKIVVKPNTEYTFTFWVKMSSLSNTAYPFVRQHQANKQGTTENQYLSLPQYKVTGKQEWTKVSANFTTESDVYYIYLWVLAGEPGTIWLDDYNLSEYIEPTPAPNFPSGISVTAIGGDEFKIGIKGWNDAHKYQVWTYQETTSGVFGVATEKNNEWFLANAYTSPSGYTSEADGSISLIVNDFKSIDNNYTVAVRIIDSDGNYIGQIKETYSAADTGVVAISKVTVDGEFAVKRAFVKDIDSETPVKITVTGNDVPEIVYTANVDQTAETLAASGNNENEFFWNISGKKPGDYTVTVKATSGETYAERKIRFRLYQNTATEEYGELNSLGLTKGDVETGKFNIKINANIESGANYKISVSEPWRSAISPYPSSLKSIEGKEINDTAVIAGDRLYGTYQVALYTYRNGVASADDGAIRTIKNARPGETSFDVTTNISTPGSVLKSEKNTPITLTATSSGIPDPEYSFWRRDANGWVLIRNYMPGHIVTWAPHRVGLYTIQVRVKESGGLTYEEIKNIEFEIEDTGIGGDEKAVVTGITLSVDGTATARTPVTITANVETGPEDLLYKYIISNGYIYYVETAYSMDPTYVWVPAKKGEYTVTVLVKNKVSFGKYDDFKSFTEIVG